MRNFSKSVLCFFIGCTAYLSGHANAQNGAHFNNAELRREGSNTVALTLYLNWPQVLHQLLAPQMPLRIFLKTYWELPDLPLESEMAKVGVQLTAKAYFTLPSGARVNFKQWQLPDRPSLRESFKLSLMLLDMPAIAQAHLDPVKVTAEAKSKNALTQVQIQLPKVLYPILVHSKNDNFWLTEQIPLAIINF